MRALQIGRRVCVYGYAHVLARLQDFVAKELLARRKLVVVEKLLQETTKLHAKDAAMLAVHGVGQVLTAVDLRVSRVHMIPRQERHPPPPPRALWLLLLEFFSDVPLLFKVTNACTRHGQRLLLLRIYRIYRPKWTPGIAKEKAKASTAANSTLTTTDASNSAMQSDTPTLLSPFRTIALTKTTEVVRIGFSAGDAMTKESYPLVCKVAKGSKLTGSIYIDDRVHLSGSLW